MIKQAKAEWLVVLGASAGGLEALERFLKHCPTDLVCGYVVIQHLSPDYKSIMNELLARHTTMPVLMVQEGTVPLANHVYLIPAGTTITLDDAGFRVVQKLPHQFSLPIDVFLYSTAELFKQKTIAVIFSGTGSDGSKGCIAVHEAGGVVIAQQPDEAKFDGMPKSVINTEIVDFTLSAADIPLQIQSLLLQPFAPMPTEPPLQNMLIDAPQDDMQDILNLLHRHSQINFGEYKEATIIRRIERRLQQLNLANLKAYLQLLLQNDSEIPLLINDILIPVTSFMRDKEVWQLLTEDIITSIVQHADPHHGIRCWSAGTSTGEEAYSLAIGLLETCAALKKPVPIKIFATDVNPKNIERAALGCYSKEALNDLPDELKKRYFEQTADGFQVKPLLRQTIVFAKHNLLTDPPFTRMSLVLCRNVLIYFKSDAQLRVLQRLQFAVDQGGFLVLGSSESLGEEVTDFIAVSAKAKVFQRIASDQPQDFALGLSNPLPGLSKRSQRASQHAQQQVYETHVEVGKNLLLQHFAPPSLLVDAEGRVLQFFGGVQNLIRVKQGIADLTLARLLPEKLVPVAAALLYKARKEQQPVMSETVVLDTLHCETPLKVQVLPISSVPNNQYFLVCLVETVSYSPAPSSLIQLDEAMGTRIQLLESELQATRESLQATIEELETANEELQATNEELMASNEELQSANEELQSVNEELNTVNAEYHEKMLLMQRAHADLDSLSRATGIATLFLDEQLCIRYFTPALNKLFKIRPTDLGRPVDELVHILAYPELQAHLADALSSGLGREHEVTAEDGKCYLARILCYQVKASDAKGLVLSFIDITAVKESADLQMVINALPEHIAVLDQAGDIVLVNRAWQQFAQLNGDPQHQTTGVGCNYLSVCQHAMDPLSQQALVGLKAVLQGSQSQFSLVYPCHSLTEQRWFVMHVKQLQHANFVAVVSHFNISAYMSNQKNDLV